MTKLIKSNPWWVVAGALLVGVSAQGVEKESTEVMVWKFSEPELKKWKWQITNDGVMGGLSKGRIQTAQSGAMVFSGMLSLENNGGFSTVRTTRFSSHDLSAYEGIALKVRGDGRRYKVNLATDARWRSLWEIMFSAEFVAPAGEDWVEVKLPFSKFSGSFRGRTTPETKLAPDNIRRLGIIIADKKEGPFRLEVASIYTY